MAWAGSKIYAYFVLNQFNQIASTATLASDTLKNAVYLTGTPVNTGTTLVSTEYGASWNTCTETGNSGTYAAGGSALTAPSSAQSTNTWVLSCSTANSWTGTTMASVCGSLIYDSTVAAHPGICFLDYGGAQSVTAGTFTVTYAPNIAVITLT